MKKISKDNLILIKLNNREKIILDNLFENSNSANHSTMIRELIKSNKSDNSMEMLNVMSQQSENRNNNLIIRFDENEKKELINSAKEYKLDNSKCSTIICNQGSTINEHYMIHDIGALPKGQLVTAISRSSSYDNIYFKL